MEIVLFDRFLQPGSLYDLIEKAFDISPDKVWEEIDSDNELFLYTLRSFNPTVGSKNKFESPPSLFYKKEFDEVISLLNLRNGVIENVSLKEDDNVQKYVILGRIIKLLQNNNVITMPLIKRLILIIFALKLVGGIPNHLNGHSLIIDQDILKRLIDINAQLIMNKHSNKQPYVEFDKLLISLSNIFDNKNLWSNYKDKTEAIDLIIVLTMLFLLIITVRRYNQEIDSKLRELLSGDDRSIVDELLQSLRLVF